LFWLHWAGNISLWSPFDGATATAAISFWCDDDITIFERSDELMLFLWNLMLFQRNGNRIELKLFYSGLGWYLSIIGCSSRRRIDLRNSHKLKNRWTWLFILLFFRIAGLLNLLLLLLVYLSNIGRFLRLFYYSGILDLFVQTWHFQKVIQLLGQRFLLNFFNG